MKHRAQPVHTAAAQWDDALKTIKAVIRGRDDQASIDATTLALELVSGPVGEYVRLDGRVAS